MNASRKQGSSQSALISFFIMTFAVSWLVQLPRVLADNQLAELPLWLAALSNLAPFGPFLAAFWLTYRAGGREAVKKLWKRGWDFSFEKKWLGIVLLIPVVTAGLTVLAIYLLGFDIPWENQPLPLAFAVPVLIIIFLTQALPEEYGWRGFALDRLQSRWNALTASLALGFLWGLWHLPLHFMSGTTQEVIPVAEFILKQMVGAIFYTWVYNNTNRNVFLAILLHALWNVFGGLIPYWVTSEGRWVNFGVELLIAAALVVIYGARTLAKDRTQASA